MTGFVPLHDKEHFYKYYNAEATKLVLRNLAVKWSSPALFNDPFDLQINLDFGFDLDEVDKFFYEETSRIVFSDDDPEGDISNPDNMPYGVQISEELAHNSLSQQTYLCCVPDILLGKRPAGREFPVPDLQQIRSCPHYPGRPVLAAINYLGTTAENRCDIEYCRFLLNGLCVIRGKGQLCACASSGFPGS